MQRRAAVRIALVGGALVGAVLLAGACSNSEPKSNETLEPAGPTPEELAAQEEAERLEREAKVAAFCDPWVELVCRAAMGCHPSATSTHFEWCARRYMPFCEDRIEYVDYDAAAAEACFTAGSTFDCSTDLVAFFHASCNTVFPGAERPPLGTVAPGEHCRSDRECVAGAICQVIGGCQNECVVPPGADQPCNGSLCADGLECVTEQDDRGLDVRMCRLSENPDPEPVACSPWQQYVESEARCVDKSLPGEACGGEFDLECVGASYCDGGSCGAEGENGSTCFDQGDCDWPYYCYLGYSGGAATCRPSEEAPCGAHPMLLRWTSTPN